MNAPMMNKLQLCSAGSAGPQARPQRAVAERRREGLSPRGARRAAMVVVSAATLAAVAAAWLVFSHPAPLSIVELPRVVIVAQRLPPGTCPVPVEPADANCPVPMQQTPAGTAQPELARSTQP